MHSPAAQIRRTGSGGIVRSIARPTLVGLVMAINEMRAHKTRSLLSIIGVTLGVGALVAMLTLVGGIETFLHDKMGRWIGTIGFMKKWSPSDEERLSWSRSPGMRLSDGAWLEQEDARVAYAMKSIERRGQVTIGGERFRTRIRGVDEATLMEDREHIVIKQGRWLSAEDYRDGNRTCLLSWEMEDRVTAELRRAGKKATDILSLYVTYNNVRFRIVGTIAPADTMYKPWQLRRVVILPIRAMQNYLVGFDPDPGIVQVRLKDPEMVKEDAERISATLKARHRGVMDFEYRTADRLDEVMGMLRNATLLIMILSTISLTVGGLSIMNVMLSSISERVREIGVRKALGASDLQIFVQFITESVALSCIGGCVGAALGTLPLFFKGAIQRSTDGSIIPTILPEHVLYVSLVIIGVGVFFGLYPAIKASRMNPIDALRYE